MLNITDKDCTGCHACFNICPQNCIVMTEDNEGFLYPQIDEDKCNDCGLCKKICPLNTKNLDGDNPKAYAAWNKDDEIRNASSSGGVFTALADKTLKAGGVVFGAIFDENMILKHIAVQHQSDMNKLRGSKYVQSIIGETFKETKSFLESDRDVIFSGTPCQIAGLYSYLGKDYARLLTVDVVCHGVPSPKVFDVYKSELENKFGGKTIDISFRDKSKGWKNFSISLSFDNNTQYREVLTLDLFLQGFLQNLYLRPSCHTCPFSRIPRVADISLADFWEVNSHHPEWDDDKGTSLILTQTEKGDEALKSCQEALYLFNAPLDKAILANPCICKPVPPNKNRGLFFTDFNNSSFKNVIAKYCRVSIRAKKMKLKRLFSMFIKKCFIINKAH